MVDPKIPKRPGSRPLPDLVWTAYEFLSATKKRHPLDPLPSQEIFGWLDAKGIESLELRNDIYMLMSSLDLQTRAKLAEKNK